MAADRKLEITGPSAPAQIALWTCIAALSALGWAGLAGLMWLTAQQAPRRIEVVERVEPVEMEPSPPAVPPPATRMEDGVLVRNPMWARRPQPVFPARAMRNGVEAGSVVLRCESLAEGVLGACEVLEEGPPGQGFAEAAVASTREARLAPRQMDGQPTDGVVTFTVVRGQEVLESPVWGGTGRYPVT